MSNKKAFVAYPAASQLVCDTVKGAVKISHRLQNNIEYEVWEENDIAGHPITQPTLSKIDQGACLVADITNLNFNVTYEIGYAIGRSKRVFLIRHDDVESNVDLFRNVGIFDTLGFIPYKSRQNLGEYLSDITNFSPISIAESIDKYAPVYILEPLQSEDTLRRVVSLIKRTRLRYRSFNPSEEVRLSALDAIAHVSKSLGVIVLLLSKEIRDSSVNNIRAAFVAGLAHGMEKETLILQHSDDQTPLDVRDFTKTYQRLDDIGTHVSDFAYGVHDARHQESPEANFSSSYLADLFIGDPMAENEFATLRNYYLRTDEFHRVRRGEIGVVVGRKGMGKTALFSQMRDIIRQYTPNIVVDLKPEGYQLVKLKENVLDFLSEGAREHLITVFWEYLLLSEVTHKILEIDKNRHRYDHQISGLYLELKEKYANMPKIGQGDFSERLLYFSNMTIDRFRDKFAIKPDKFLTTEQITNILRIEHLANLRESLENYLRYKREVWLLFDNLDKGWSSYGVGDDDVLILRCLLDAAKKIQRALRRRDLDFYSVVFVRNDVYELLIQNSSDFGKDMQASLDWSDGNLLREMLRRRLIGKDGENEDFTEVWHSICVPLYEGEETSQYLINRSLMRPRNLLKLFINCRGHAVNMGHQKIEEDDIKEGVKMYSHDLLAEADREIRDIEPLADNLIYRFIGEMSSYEKDEIHMLLEDNNIPTEKFPHLIDHMLYYGFLGIQYENQEEYIYNLAWDMRALRARADKHAKNLRYILNPAFWPALEVTPN